MQLAKIGLSLCILVLSACSAQPPPEPPEKNWLSWWSESTRPEEPPPEEKPSGGRTALLWIPNRILDFIDIFKFDVGVGPAAGAVVRVTPWGQAGYRQMLPVSVRVGDFGRDWPVKVEHSSEVGVGPAFLQSSSRKVCSGEVGIGLDLFIVGAYGGICFDELADFILGIGLVDFKEDDLK